MQKTASYTFASKSELLMNKFSFGKKPDQIGVGDLDALNDTVRTKALAELATYRNDDGYLVIPANNIFRALITAGKKVKKGKSNFSTVVSAAVQVECLILRDANGKPLTEFVTDIQRGKNPSTGGSVVIIRAKIPVWYGTLAVEYNDEDIKETDLLQIMEALGRQVGFLDFRPEKHGRNGQFSVTTTAAVAVAKAGR